MKINEQCLPCLVNQAIKTARLANAENREALYSKIFAQMSRMDFSKTNPEIIGENYRLIKEHVGSADPYREIKSYYNRLFSEQMDTFGRQIHSLEDAVKYAIVANIIDFNPIHGDVQENVQHFFSDMENLSLTVNDVDALRRDIETARSILYIGDNCGEICFDKLLIKRIKDLNPHCTVYFGVRGEAVVNDNTEEDAYAIGMDECAAIISNGDYALGTVLPRVSPAFREVYRNADVVIAKGQANYESLSDEAQNIYFLLMVKCRTIAEYIGVKEKSLVCLKNRCKASE
ncbi:MAG: damage-control phosphatase ARMT1 family protein [Hominenteromicrobium sp.]